jgi:DNA-directed RNA polymerase specialized sigma24 family protein
MLWAHPESQHQAFVLRHWSGLSQDEIADVATGLVQALAPTARERSHIASCRRCRAAQTRLLRAS